MNTKLATSVAAALALGLGVGAYSGNSGISNTHAASVPAAAVAPPVGAQPSVASRGLPDFSALVEREGPAVVNISVVSLKRRTAADPNDPSLEFFRRFGIPLPQERAQPSQGQGSGFIVSPDGNILTNAHVVADATEVTVKLTDKREFKAKVLGVDRRTDVALVKIDATNLPVVHIGDSGKAKTGEWVAAIGSPFGLENTVTAGIISAKSRSLPDENYVPFIQTDVAINPGNSGGPLFNMNGEVIGINSQIYSQTGGYMGLSFAIPIDVAMKVKDQLQQHGKVSRGRLGVAVQGVSKELAESFGLSKAQGALVNSVEKASPAEKAGLLTGDVILAVNGTAIDQSADLPRVIGDLRHCACKRIDHAFGRQHYTVHQPLLGKRNTDICRHRRQPCRHDLRIQYRCLLRTGSCGVQTLTHSQEFAVSIKHYHNCIERYFLPWLRIAGNT
jgi:serine protease Do